MRAAALCRSDGVQLRRSVRLVGGGRRRLRRVRRCHVVRRQARRFTRRVGECRRVVSGVRVARPLLGISQLEERVNRDEPSDRRVVVPGPDLGESRCVGGVSQEAVIPGPADQPGTVSRLPDEQGSDLRSRTRLGRVHRARHGRPRATETISRRPFRGQQRSCPPRALPTQRADRPVHGADDG